MALQRTTLARCALDKSLEVRDEAGLDFTSPLCVFDLCDRLGVKVQFVDDISMEGVYVTYKRPTIIVSSLRPLPRRVFNCAHELGHHVFKHGSTIDELNIERDRAAYTPEEFLADTFAGFLLMPALGVSRAFAVRGWDPQTATPDQVFIVASSFGVGYTTLASHLAYGLKMIDHQKAVALKKSTLPAIRASLLGANIDCPLLVVDRNYAIPTIDAEVGMMILFPNNAKAESSILEPIGDVPRGRLFIAKRPGLVRVQIPGSSWAVIARISRFQYAGLGRYRHLEEVDDE